MRRSVRSLVALCGVGLGLILALPPAEAGEATPNDPVFEEGLQWGLQRIGAPGAWAVGTGEGITIAVVDSGVDLAHEDLAAQLEGDVSCVGSGGSADACTGSGQDDNGHGTHVAGIALAATDNSRGVAGVAPGARLLAVRVLENTCEDSDPCTATGSADDVAAGIRWAADQGADIINLSLGGGTLEDVFGCAFCDAVEYAWSKGAIAVVAGGNDSALPASFSDEHAVVVTATTRADTRASYSEGSTAGLEVGRWPVSAPGGEAEGDPNDCSTGGTPKGILSTYWAEGEQNSYACLAGTSMAVPHVSGALAVLRSTGLSPQASVDRLVQTSQDLGAPGQDSEFGSGRIDLGRAVGTAPGGTSTTSGVPGGTTTTDTMVVASAEGSSTTTAPRPTTTTAPPVSLPPVAAPAVFDAAAPPIDDDDLPAGLVALAMLAVLATGGASVVTARRLAHENRAAAVPTAGRAYGGAPPPAP